VEDPSAASLERAGRGRFRFVFSSLLQSIGLTAWGQVPKGLREGVVRSRTDYLTEPQRYGATKSQENETETLEESRSGSPCEPKRTNKAVHRSGRSGREKMARSRAPARSSRSMEGSGNRSTGRSMDYG
jgi:hypothetical protein